MVEGRLDVAELRFVLSRLGDAEGVGGVADAQLIDEIAVLERIKRACAAQQARRAVAFDTSQRERQRAQEVRPERVGRGIGEQIGLARRESPNRGVRHLVMARALVGQMPHTLAALAAGDIDEWSAGLAVRETSCLGDADRRRVDAELADRLPAMSPLQVRGAAWAAACRLDPESAVKRNAKAVNERRVSVRPAPDCMTYLTALLPVKEGVACYAALVSAAKTANFDGDPRGSGQVMADTLVERLTGAQPSTATTTATTTGTVTSASDPAGAAASFTDAGPGTSTDAAAGAPAGGPQPRVGETVELQLVMTDAALLAGGDDPALVTSELSGSNPAAGLVPAPVARDIVRDAARVFVRRLYVDPGSGQLVAMESTRRVFDGNLRRMLLRRDGVCRTPWCGAPIRHGDHVAAHADGGPTSLANGQGLCERCNQTKALPGWRAETIATPADVAPARHVVRTTTPTGHTYDSTAPPLLPSVGQAPARRSGAAAPPGDPALRLRPCASGGGPRPVVELDVDAALHWHALAG